MSKATPGPYTSRKYHGSDEDLALLKEYGREPVPALTNEGQRFIMAGEKRIALVDCQVRYKRGQGHKVECEERDANTALFCAAPDLLDALKDIVSRNEIQSWFDLAQAKAAIAKAEAT